MTGDRTRLLERVLAANLAYSEARERVLEEFERAYLEKALADNGGNVAAAAAVRASRGVTSSGFARGSAELLRLVDAHVVDQHLLRERRWCRSATPGQLPPTAKLSRMKNGWSHTQVAPAGSCDGVTVQ